MQQVTKEPETCPECKTQSFVVSDVDLNNAPIWLVCLKCNYDEEVTND